MTTSDINAAAASEESAWLLLADIHLRATTAETDAHGLRRELDAERAHVKRLRIENDVLKAERESMVEFINAHRI